MTDPPDARVPCPGCGKTLRFPAGTPPDKEFRCPRCAARVKAPGAAPETAEAVFLPTCPVCAKGKVVAGASSGEEVYVCSHCDSRLSETIFGYLYLQLDPRYAKGAAKVKNQTFTRQQLVAMSARAAETGLPSLASGDSPAAERQKEPEPPTPTPTPPPLPAPRAEEEKEPEPESSVTAEDLLSEMSVRSKSDDRTDDELWWEIDEEELAKRKGSTGEALPEQAGKAGSGGAEPTLDDLLGNTET